MSAAQNPPITLPGPGGVEIVSEKPPVIALEGEKFEVIAKPPGRKSRNEALAWLVARRLSLPVLPAWLADFGEGLCFAVKRVALETLKDAGIGYDAPFFGEAVRAPWFAGVFVFDTLVANYDRVLRNLAFRPKAPSGEFVLIDHDKIFFNDAWTAAELLETRGHHGHNNLARFNGLLDEAAKAGIVKCAQAWQRDLAGEDFGFLDQLAAGGLIGGDDLAAARAFIRRRAGTLTPLVYRQLQK